MKSFKGIQAAPSGGAMVNQRTEPEGCWRWGRGAGVTGAEKNICLTFEARIVFIRRCLSCVTEKLYDCERWWTKCEKRPNYCMRSCKEKKKSYVEAALQIQL